MSKTRKLRLDTNDISYLITDLKILSNNLKKVPKEISKEVANLGKEYLDNQYDTTNTDQTIDINTISTEVIEKNYGYDIVASGKEVLYAEFGTGEHGFENQHPRKSEFNLNDYNSGDTIRINKKTGRHFWWYNGYSEGNASGKQVFNTSKYLKDSIIKKVMKEKVGEVISKV